jgi:hypothetical protein
VAKTKKAPVKGKGKGTKKTVKKTKKSVTPW